MASVVDARYDDSSSTTSGKRTNSDGSNGAHVSPTLEVGQQGQDSHLIRRLGRVFAGNSSKNYVPKYLPPHRSASQNAGNAGSSAHGGAYVGRGDSYRPLPLPQRSQDQQDGSYQNQAYSNYPTHQNARQDSYTSGYTSASVDLTDPYTPRMPPDTLPKFFRNPLTCFYWAKNGTCSKTDDECMYAHHMTGRIADAPVRVADVPSRVIAGFRLHNHLSTLGTPTGPAPVDTSNWAPESFNMHNNLNMRAIMLDKRERELANQIADYDTARKGYYVEQDSFRDKKQTLYNILMEAVKGLENHENGIRTADHVFREILLTIDNYGADASEATRSKIVDTLNETVLVTLGMNMSVESTLGKLRALL